MSRTCTVYILYLCCANNIIHTSCGANLELFVCFEFESVLSKYFGLEYSGAWAADPDCSSNSDTQPKTKFDEKLGPCVSSWKICWVDQIFQGVSVKLEVLNTLRQGLRWMDVPGEKGGDKTCEDQVFSGNCSLWLPDNKSENGYLIAV